MRTYELEIKYDGSFKLSPSLNWKLNPHGPGYCLKTPGASFLVVSRYPLEVHYLSDLQIQIPPTWDVVDELPPTTLILSPGDAARMVLLLVKSELPGVELCKLIQRPFVDLALPDPNTVYGQMESENCGLFCLEFGQTRTLHVNKKKLTIRVEKDSGKLFVS